MAGTTIDIDTIVQKDNVACDIASKWTEWDNLKGTQISIWKEVQQYIFATDTKHTSNAKLPWKNTTTIPKLAQIRENLYTNYVSAMFPSRRWMFWEGDDKKSEEKDKREAIENYMSWAVDRADFRSILEKLVLDFIDYGNCFSTVEWYEGRVVTPDGQTKVGYAGPRPVRISPLDIVFNPLAASFADSPKIIRSLITIGEAKKLIGQLTTDENKEEMEMLFQYMRDIRKRSASGADGNWTNKDNFWNVSGFGNFQQYLSSNYVELLTFYGDLYDFENDKLYENHQIMVVDRHKQLSAKPINSFFGRPPIFHAGWRTRQDSLWAMGPLENLVGMQYRIDHLENLKADLYDLTAFPPIMVTGYVDDFTWAPGVKIYVGDEGKVEIVSPDVNALNANLEIQVLEAKMEEMAGSPKEAMGFRTPGEKTKYEVQQLENAANRVFVNKISRFEEQQTENILNASLELAQRKMDATTIRVINDEFAIATFATLTPDDITGFGRIRPLAARHYAEKANMIQNLTGFFSSPVGMDPNVLNHFSSIEVAKMFEDLLDIRDWGIVTPYIRLSEQADAQRHINASEESVAMETMTPSGLTPEDSDAPFAA